jgi:predicted nucleic acid-binding Zn ribbon protein
MHMIDYGSNTCICCGCYIPDGRQVCKQCNDIEKDNKRNDLFDLARLINMSIESEKENEDA